MPSVLFFLTSSAWFKIARYWDVNSDPAKNADVTSTEPSPSSTLEFGQMTQTTLHRLVAEGDIGGVR